MELRKFLGGEVSLGDGGTKKEVKWIDKFLPSTIHINVEVTNFQPLKFHFFLCVFVFEL